MKNKIKLMFFMIGLMSCSTIKVPPVGVNYESPLRKSENVQFLYDLTYLDKNGNINYDRKIWDKTYEVLNNAKDYLIIEMFLFNDIYNKDKENFPQFAKEYTEKLVKKKRENPNLKVYVLSDENNNMYGAFEHPFIKEMKNAGIEVIEVGIMELKDTFPWYSPIWRTFIKPMGNPQNKGWITNFYGDMWPKLTIRNLLRALNVKADHKKVFLNEKEVIVSGANIHDPSYYHENVAIYADGEITKDVLDNLQKVAKFSNGDINVGKNEKNEKMEKENEIGISVVEKEENEKNKDRREINIVEKGEDEENKKSNNEVLEKNIKKEKQEYEIQYLSEAKIGEYLDKDIDSLNEGDELLMGMYFLADRDVVNKLIEAGNRGVKIRIILDRSRDAFGMSTNGLPNKPVSKKLKKKTDNKIEIKWYFTNNEQYHTKLIMMKKNDGKVIVHSGSANLIKKNIRGYIMDSNFRVITNKNSNLSKEIYTYFDRLWYNKDGIFTLNYEDEVTTKWTSDLMYEILDKTQLGSF